MALAVGSIIIATAISCCIVALFVYHFRRRHLYQFAAKLPGPPTLPIIGNAHYFFGNTSDILVTFIGLFKSYPSLLRIWLVNHLLVVAYEAEHIKTLLFNSKSIEKPVLYEFSRPLAGTGLITASAAKWRIHRKLIQPTFNIRILESFVKVFANQSQILTEQMKKELNSGEFNVHRYISLRTLGIICETAMGVPLKTQTGQYSQYVGAVNRILEIIVIRGFRFWLHSDLIFNFTKWGKEQDKHLQVIHGLSNDVIRKKKNICRNVTREANGNAEEQTVTKKTFLDLLLHLSHDNSKLTVQELRDEVYTMMTAGYDTTATANCFVMLMLANYPEIQERAYQELCEIYGDEVSSDLPIKIEDLKRMEYLERIIKETMRLFPVVPFIGREISEDLDMGDYTLPKGASVFLAIIQVHRYEKYWPDPLKFDPDRFLPSEIEKRHPYSYIPFSGGPRNCIGLRFAMMSMKVLIATVLRRYVIKNNKTLNIQDIKLKLNVVLTPVNPVMIKIEERIANANQK